MSPRWGAGERFGRYRIESLLGRGGMGEVYVAHDTQLGRHVALKILPGGGDDASLLREARAAAAIDHPNVAQVFDVDTVDGVPFLAMELVAGKPLRAYVGDPSVTLETKVKWLVAIGRALEAAHRRGIVHRDVKPENVIVREDGAIKVLDFGIARVVPLVDRGAETRTGPGTPAPVVSVVGATHGTNVKGTLAYMAPEQVRGETIDSAADQWAWGIVAYELLSGELPWRARRDPLAMVAEILSREPDAIAGVGAEVNAVVARATAKRRGDRFESVSAAFHGLETAGSSAVITGTSYSRRIIGAVILVAVVSISALAAALIKHRHTPSVDAPDSAPSSKNGGPPDYGSQMSQNPEAMAAYLKGVRGQNGAGTELTVLADFNRARRIDPSFAAAYLRALLALEPVEESYEILARAQELRSQLSSHDRVLLETIEPYFRTPPDPHEFRRRLDLLPWQNDADYSLRRCMFLFRLHEDVEGLEACRNAKRLTPDLATAYFGVGVGLRRLGDLEAANRELDGCSSQFPSASQCVQGLARIQMLNGACAERVTTLQRAVEMAPDESDVRRMYATGVLGRDLREGRDTAEYRSAADVYIDRFAREGRTSAEIEAERSYYESVALVVEGRLEEAVAVLERELPFYRRTQLEVDISSVYSEQLLILVELGRKRDAIALAHRWIDEREAWVPGTNLNSRIWPTIALYRVGVLDRKDFIEERRKWALDADQHAFGFRPSIWAIAYGEAIFSPEDAADALAAQPHYAPFPACRAATDVDATMGAALLRTGNVSEAIVRLRAATACEPVPSLMLYIQAFADLGDALVKSGDRTGACAAYATVLRRWGATAGSVTAKRVRAQQNAVCR